MGKKYIKKEVVNGEEVEIVYEEGFFIDRKIGKFHKKWDGSKETRPDAFDFLGSNPKVTVEREKFLSDERRGSIGDQEGTFKRDEVFGIEIERYPSFKPDEDEEPETSPPGLVQGYGFETTGSTTIDISRQTPRRKQPKKRETSPFQHILGDLFCFLKLKKLSEFFYSAAATTYSLRGDFLFAGKLHLKAGEVDHAIRIFALNDLSREVRGIMREQGLEERLVKELESCSKIEQAAETARYFGMRRKAMEHYELAGNMEDINTAIRSLEEAARIALELGEEREAARLYRLAGNRGISKYLGASIDTRLQAKSFLEEANKLEETQTQESQNS